MIELLPDMPEHVVGIVASGQVNASDYETVIMSAIESALSTHDRIRLLYQLEPAFTGFTAGAMWDDMRVGMAHRKVWERIAVVTDEGWVAGAIRLFGFTMPCPVRIFSNTEFAEAVNWISSA
jgi:hypothetical protein